MIKPDIIDIKTEKELRPWYWTKAELREAAKFHGVSPAGAKFDVLDRICDKLEGRPLKPHKISFKSKFNWSSERITSTTVITDSYKSSAKVREFMQSKVPGFKFNITFLKWVKANQGKTMADAVEYYKYIKKSEESGRRAAIEPHNQFNKYLRDFFKDNPSLTQKEAKQCWLYVTGLPSDCGRHVYSKKDLIVLGKKS